MRFEEREFTDMYCQIKCEKCGRWTRQEEPLEPDNQLTTMHMLRFRGTAHCDHCRYEFPILVEYTPYEYLMGVERMVSMYDYMIQNDLGDGADCYDDTLDYGTAMSPWNPKEDGSLDGYGEVNNYILRNTEFVRVSQWNEHDLVGDFWRFADEHYEQFREFCRECNNEHFQMDDEVRNENLSVAVYTAINIVKGCYGDSHYVAFKKIFGIEEVA
jgi:hypothetical protein